MGPIKLKTWVVSALILFVLGVLADYYFLHILFKEKHGLNSPTNAAAKNETAAATGTAKPTDPAFTSSTVVAEPTSAETTTDNFLENLKKCAPEVAAQAVATPEAFVEYLRKSVGVKDENISIQNFHLTLPDGSARRLHIIASDTSNAPAKEELRYFKIDAEGYPERIPLQGTETKESILASGKVTAHEQKSVMNLKDKSRVALETHDGKVYEFQYTSAVNKILSCRFTDCQCP